MDSLMEVDDDIHQMEIDDNPELILGINQLEYGCNNICTIKSLNNAANILKFDNYEEFMVFKNNEEINANKYPDLFVFTVNLSELSEIFFDPVKEEILKKFDDNRALVIEFKKLPSDTMIFVKNGENFEQKTEISQYQLILNLSQNIFDFSTFLAVLKHASDHDIIFDLVCKSKNILLAKFLNLFAVDVDKKIEMIDAYIEDSNDLKFLCALLDFPFDFGTRHKVSKSSQKLMATHGLKILKKAVEFRKRVFVDFLLNCFKSCFDICDFYQKLEISKIAHDTDIDGNFIYLIKADFPFPPICSNLYGNIFDNRRGLHDAIVRNDIEKVEELAEEYQFTRIAYDSLNNSALWKALKDQKLEIFALLHSRCFKTCSQENIDDLMQVLTQNQRESIVQLKIKFSTKNPKKFALIIASKAHLHNQLNYLNEDDEKFKKIRKLLFELNDIPLVKLIFKITADVLSSVNFDFTSKSIYGMHPTSKSYLKTFGVCYFRKAVIFIGAAHDDKDIKDTIVHEFTHLAMQVIYENDALPHFAHRQDLKNQFDRVIRLSKRKRFTIYSEKVLNVYKEYENEELSPELIVVMFVMIAELHNDPSSLAAFRQTYKELSTFYEKVKKDLENFDPQTRKEIRDLNIDFGVIKKIQYNLRFHSATVDDTTNQVFISKIPSLTLTSVYQQMSELYEKLVDVNCIFVDFNELLIHSHIFERYRKIVESNDVRVIVDLTQEIKHAVRQKGINSKLDLFLEIFTHENLKFILILSDVESSNFLHLTDISFENSTNCWDYLTCESKKNISTRLINFQGKSLKLSDIVDETNANCFFNENILSECLKDQILNVNEVPNLNEFLERSLILKYKISTPKSMSKNQYLRGICSNLEEYEIKLISEDKEKETCAVLITENKQEKFKENEILEKCRGLNYVLISDAAGSGKSSTLIKIRDKIKLKYPLNFIFFVDLKLFDKDFQTIRDQVNFVEFFKNKIMKSQSDFEKSIFDYFYHKKRIFILFDGFDEISLDFKKEVLTLIKSFEFKNESQLFITTRDHLEIDLKQELNIEKVFSLCPLSENEQKEIVICCLQSLKVSGDLEQNANKLIEKLSKVIKSSNSDPFGLPQDLKIITSAFVKNNKIEENYLETFTGYSIYRKAIKNLRIIWKREKGSSATEASENADHNNTSFDDVHKFLAMKSYFESDEDFCSLTLDSFWDNDKIKQCGIVRDFENNSPIFLHENYKEVFAAIFTVQNLDQSQKWRYYDELFNYLSKFLHDLTFKYIRAFISDGLKECKKMCDSKYETFAPILREVIERNDFKILVFAAIEGCEELVNFLIKIIEKILIQDSLIFQTIFIKKLFNQNIEQSFGMENENFFLHLVKVKNLSIFTFFLKFLKHNLDQKDFHELIQFKTQSHENVLNFASIHDDQYFECILNLLSEKCDEDCMIKLLTSKSIRNSSLLFYLANSTEKLKVFWKYLVKFLQPDKLIEFAYSKDFLHLTVFHLAILNENSQTFEFLMEKLNPKVNIFNTRCQAIYNQTLFQMTTHVDDPFFHETFWKCLRKFYLPFEIYSLLTEINKDSNTMLHNLVSFCSKEVMKIVFDQLNETFNIKEQNFLLNLEGYNKRNLIQKSADRVERDVEDLNFLWNYLRRFYEDNIEGLLYYEDKNNDNVLHIIVAFSTKEVFEAFIKFLESFMDEKKIKYYLQTYGMNNKNLLQRAVSLNKSLSLNSAVWKVMKNYILYNLTQLVDYEESYRSNLLHVAVAFAPLSICKLTWKMIKSVHCEEMHKDYLMRKGFRNQSLVKNCENKNRKYPEVADWLRDLFKEYNVYF